MAILSVTFWAIKSKLVTDLEVRIFQLSSHFQASELSKLSYQLEDLGCCIRGKGVLGQILFKPVSQYGVALG